MAPHSQGIAISSTAPAAAPPQPLPYTSTALQSRKPPPVGRSSLSSPGTSALRGEPVTTPGAAMRRSATTTSRWVTHGSFTGAGCRFPRESPSRQSGPTRGSTSRGLAVLARCFREGSSPGSPAGDVPLPPSPPEQTSDAPPTSSEIGAHGAASTQEPYGNAVPFIPSTRQRHQNHHNTAAVATRRAEREEPAAAHGRGGNGRSAAEPAGVGSGEEAEAYADLDEEIRRQAHALREAMFLEAEQRAIAVHPNILVEDLAAEATVPYGAAGSLDPPASRGDEGEAAGPPSRGAGPHSGLALESVDPDTGGFTTSLPAVDPAYDDVGRAIREDHGARGRRRRRGPTSSLLATEARARKVATAEDLREDLLAAAPELQDTYRAFGLPHSEDPMAASDGEVEDLLEEMSFGLEGAVLAESADLPPEDVSALSDPLGPPAGGGGGGGGPLEALEALEHREVLDLLESGGASAVASTSFEGDYTDVSNVMPSPLPDIPVPESRGGGGRSSGGGGGAADNSGSSGPGAHKVAAPLYNTSPDVPDDELEHPTPVPGCVLLPRDTTPGGTTAIAVPVADPAGKSSGSDDLLNAPNDGRSSATAQATPPQAAPAEPLSRASATASKHAPRPSRPSQPPPLPPPSPMATTDNGRRLRSLRDVDRQFIDSDTVSGWDEQAQDLRTAMQSTVPKQARQGCQATQPPGGRNASSSQQPQTIGVHGLTDGDSVTAAAGGGSNSGGGADGRPVMVMRVEYVPSQTYGVARTAAVLAADGQLTLLARPAGPSPERVRAALKLLRMAPDSRDFKTSAAEAAATAAIHDEQEAAAVTEAAMAAVAAAGTPAMELEAQLRPPSPVPPVGERDLQPGLILGQGPLLAVPTRLAVRSWKASLLNDEIVSSSDGLLTMLRSLIPVLARVFFPSLSLVKSEIDPEEVPADPGFHLNSPWMDGHGPLYPHDAYAAPTMMGAEGHMLGLHANMWHEEYEDYDEVMGQIHDGQRSGWSEDGVNGAFNSDVY
ncbi:hypothetical protein VOLCADRAFT_85772 [Volvox carteri f. nagariensis]|uniref:Uncharacterized protein n=1 Tax=Volvox carteri f. nagariensis TaxID=3068 RepID=D8TGY0_VOLCA|nr:uncharacterized protein VOLCADRAFT_85772 [Volvox carteri f. nagariensis]EFJ52977.1 hypothetical protein VOLCADRAFT_85772 [Volvox carteri f. nagariensis]|eukprot:XP_002945982.1 hypothetical protein VOLCADRAFT_85772 [Volvox carteri f. nagariensis]